MFEAGSIGIRAVWQDAEARQAADAFYRDLKTKRDQFQQQGNATTSPVVGAVGATGQRPLPYQAPSNAGTYVAGPRFLQAGMMPGIVGGGNTATSAVTATANAAQFGGLSQFSLLLNSATASIRAFIVALNQASFGGGSGGVAGVGIGGGSLIGGGGGGDRGPGIGGLGPSNAGFLGYGLYALARRFAPAAATIMAANEVAGLLNFQADVGLSLRTHGLMGSLQTQESYIRSGPPGGAIGRAVLRILSPENNVETMLEENAKNQAVVRSAESTLTRMGRRREGRAEEEAIRRETERAVILNPWAARRAEIMQGFTGRRQAAMLKLDQMVDKEEWMKINAPLDVPAYRKDIEAEREIEKRRFAADSAKANADLRRNEMEKGRSNWQRFGETRAAELRMIGRHDLAAAVERGTILSLAAEGNPEEFRGIKAQQDQRFRKELMDHMLTTMETGTKIAANQQRIEYKPLSAQLTELIGQGEREIIEARGGKNAPITPFNIGGVIRATVLARQRLQMFRQELYLRGQAVEGDPTTMAFGVPGPLEGISGPAFAAGQAAQNFNPASMVGDLMSSMKDGLMGLIKDIKLLN